ncbi:UNVERIFIED_CONTAM: hypothetical protein RMT77_008197 [Armadillidium vulgare]
MPPPKNVNTLQTITMETFGTLLALSISNLINGTYSETKERSVLMKQNTTLKKSRSSAPLGISMVVPTKELQRIKKFISDNIPKSLRTELLHSVLKIVVEILLSKRKNKERKNSPPINFSEIISHLNKGIMYVFSLLLSKDTTFLNFTDVLHLSMKWVDTCRLNNKNPKEIQDYTRIEVIFLKNFAEYAKTLTNLVSLTWPHLISGDLIRVIGRHLQGLRILVLCCSCETGPFVEEERNGSRCGNIGSQVDVILSLKSLYKRVPGDFNENTSPGCPNLKKLILPNLDDEDEVGASIISEALLTLKKLEVVSGISTLLSAIKLKQNKELKTPLALKHLNDYDPFKQRVVKEVDFLKDLLPKIESVELRVSEDLTKRILEMLYDIKELSIECSTFDSISKKFTSLIYLNISLDFNCPWPLLLNLGKYCKHLKYLTLEHPTFKIDPQNFQTLKYPTMTSLIHFKLIRSSFIEFVALQMFIKGCSKLTELFITLSNDRNYMVDEFGDDLIRAIAPLMPNLEKFTAESLYKFNLYLHHNCTLSIEAANILIRDCPKIRFIGHLDSWDVKEKHVKTLLKEIKVNNWNLELA